jgi:hypothetical protein
MSEVNWKDTKARMAHARAGRARALPKTFIDSLGEAGQQPQLHAAHAERPAETPNPVLNAFEPFAFPAEPKMAHEYGDGEPRPVVEAEIEELMLWGLPKYQEIYPRCTYDSIRPLLLLACRGGRARFLRTKDATSLFFAETTPAEPELFVYQYFVVSRVNTGNGYKEAYRLIRASQRWAESVGAVGFEFGRARCSVNIRDSVDFLKRLSVIVPDQKNESWVKVLRKPVEEPAEIAPGARMAAMGMVASS